MPTTLNNPNSPTLFPPFTEPAGTKVTEDLPQLYRLMKAYTERLQSKLNYWQQNWIFTTKGYYENPKIPADFVPADSSDLIYDIQYLAAQTVRLIDKASAFREAASLADVDNIELELYLFDAETAVRLARRTLSQAGVGTKI